MHKNRIRLLAAGLLAGALAAGCAHKNPLVGTWAGNATNRFGARMTTTLTLTDDGRVTTSTQATSPAGPVQLGGTGTYTVSGNTLTETFSSLTYNGQPVPQSKGPLPEPNTFKLDGDTLTLAESKYGVTQVLTRQKS